MSQEDKQELERRQLRSALMDGEADAPWRRACAPLGATTQRRATSGMNGI